MAEISNIISNAASGKPSLYKSGDRYGRWLLTGKYYCDGRRGYVEAICDCGKIKWVSLSSFRRHKTTSCGCRASEVTAARSTIHGLAKRGRAHPTTKVWYGMKERCYNKKNQAYPNYGGRGVYICPEWLNNFKAFYDWAINNGWQKGLEIDRKDNDGIYSPPNCHFTTQMVQSRNRRSNVIIEAFGQKQCAVDWVNSSICTISLQTLLNRIRSGINPELAISTPPYKLFI